MSGNVSIPDEWTITAEPADATQATVSKGLVAGQRHHCTGFLWTLEGAGANTAEVHFVIRDSTTGAGNFLWRGKLLNLANTSVHIGMSGLNIVGVVGQALTVETVAAPAANSSVTVSMSGWTEQVGA